MGDRLESCKQLSDRCRHIGDVRYLLFDDGSIHIQSSRTEVHKDILGTAEGKTINDIVRAGYVVDMRQSFGFLSVDTRGSTTVGAGTIGEGDIKPISKALAALPDYSRFKFKFYKGK